MYIKIIKDVVSRSSGFTEKSFLKNNCTLIGENFFSVAGTSDLVVIVTAGKNYEIRSVYNLLEFTNIDTFDKFNEFVLFSLDNELVYPGAGESILNRPPYCFIADNENDPLQYKYRFMPKKDISLTDTHFKLFCNCLCDKQGKLARVCFELKDNELTITDEKVYTEKSLMFDEYYD